MNTVDGPRYALIVDGKVTARRESLSLAMRELEITVARGEFLEVKLVNVRQMSQVLGFIEGSLVEEIATFDYGMAI